MNHQYSRDGLSKEEEEAEVIASLPVLYEILKVV